MKGSGVDVLTSDVTFCGFLIPSDGPAYDPRHVKSPINTSLAQTGQFEVSMTAGAEIQGPPHRRNLLIHVLHRDDNA